MPRLTFIERVRRAAKAAKAIGGASSPAIHLYDVSDAEAVELWMDGAYPHRITREGTHGPGWTTWYALNRYTHQGDVCAITAYTKTRPAVAWEIEEEGGSVAPAPPVVVEVEPAPLPVELPVMVAPAPALTRTQLLEID